MTSFDIDLNKIDEYRKTHNTSVLAVMFTDIEGFTAYTSEHGDLKSSELLQKHNDVLSQAIKSCDGLVIKQIGDSYMAVFADPSLSVKAALTIQKELNEAGFPLKVRIGIHMGQIALVEQLSADIFGNHVNIASRVESQAKGGQIFLTKAIYDSAHTWIKTEDLKFKYHGRTKLKGIKGKEDIYQIGLKDDDFSPPEIVKKARIVKTILISISVFLIILLIGISILFRAKSQRYKEFAEVTKSGIYYNINFDSPPSILITQFAGIDHSKINIMKDDVEREKIETNILMLLKKLESQYILVDDSEVFEKLGPEFLKVMKDSITDFCHPDTQEIFKKAFKVRQLYSLTNAIYKINNTDTLIFFSMALVNTKLCFLWSINNKTEIYKEHLIEMNSVFQERQSDFLGKVHSYINNKRLIIKKNNKSIEHDNFITVGDLLFLSRNYEDFSSKNDIGIAVFLDDAEKAIDYFGSVDKWKNNYDNEFSGSSWAYGFCDSVKSGKSYLFETYKTIGPDCAHSYEVNIGIIIEVKSVSDSMIIADVKLKTYPWLSSRVGDLVYK